MAEYVSYPVFVEYSQRHIVWIEADSPEKAAERVASWPYESTNDDETLFESGLSVRAPKDRWDWKDVYSEGDYGSPYTTECDAHVEEHKRVLWLRQREAEKAACAAAGHPETESPLRDGRVFCKGCHEYLPAGTVRADAWLP